MKSEKIGIYFLIIATFLLFSTITLLYDFEIMQHEEQIGSQSVDNDKEDSTLHVLLFTHYSDYFIHHGTPMGFQYELLQYLAKSLNKKIKIDFENDPNVAFSAAFSNQYDIVATDIRQNSIFTQLLTTSSSHSTSFPVLIERKEKNKLSKEAIYRIYVPAHFPGKISLDSLPNSSFWKIKESSALTTEELFDLLDNKKIDYIASDYHTAIMLLPFYYNLKINCKIGEEYERKWVLNEENINLNIEINHWIDSFISSKKYKILVQKYFSPKNVNYNMPKLDARHHNISPYDSFIKKYAKRANIDWRFIVSMMYQESRFNSDASGAGNSFGLMQFMPNTGELYNITPESTEEEQIKAAVEHIKVIGKYFLDVKNENEKLKFICASYNSGVGHIKDAQRLCEKYGEDSSIWKNVSKYLILKSKKKFYNDEVVQNGYYPGNHTAKYVEQIWERYVSYKAIIKK